jgi:hypothetical protein
MLPTPPPPSLALPSYHCGHQGAAVAMLPHFCCHTATTTRLLPQPCCLVCRRDITKMPPSPLPPYQPLPLSTLQDKFDNEKEFCNMTDIYFV